MRLEPLKRLEEAAPKTWEEVSAEINRFAGGDVAARQARLPELGISEEWIKANPNFLAGDDIIDHIEIVRDALGLPETMQIIRDEPYALGYVPSILRKALNIFAEQENRRPSDFLKLCERIAIDRAHHKR